MTARHSLWWILFIQQPKVDCPQWNKVFRKRFRIRYQSFLGLLAMRKDESMVTSLRDVKKTVLISSLETSKLLPLNVYCWELFRTWVVDGRLMIWRNPPSSQGRRTESFFTSLLNLDPKFCLRCMSRYLQHWKSSKIVNRSIGLPDF
jgi:hypothetical protein